MDTIKTYRAWEYLDFIALPQQTPQFYNQQTEFFSVDSFGLFRTKFSARRPSPTWLYPEKSQLSSLQYLESIDCVCACSTSNILFWKSDAVLSLPQKLTFSSTVQSFVLRQAPHLLVVFTAEEVIVHSIHQAKDNSLHFKKLEDAQLTLPVAVSTTSLSDTGKIFVGGQNARIYQLVIQDRLDPRQNPVVRLEALTKRRGFFRYGRGAVRSIVVDGERKLLFSLHFNSELEVFSGNSDWLRITSIGCFHRKDVEITSIMVIPPSEQLTTCLIGLSSIGECYYFDIVKPKLKQPSSFRVLLAVQFGFASALNSLLLRATSTSISELLKSHGKSEWRVKVLNTHCGDLTLVLQDFGQNITSVVRIKRFTLQNKEEPLILMENDFMTFSGNLVSFSKRTQPQWKFPGWRCLEGIKLPADELTAQYFRLAPSFWLFTGTERMEMSKEWPYEILDRVLKSKNIESFFVFCRLYGAAETVAMTVYLALGSKEGRLGYPLLGKEIKAALCNGFYIFFKRFVSPIWTVQVFDAFQNTLSKGITFSQTVIDWYLSFLKKLRVVILDFVQQTNSFSYSTYHQVFNRLLDLHELVDRSCQVLAFLKFLSSAKSLCNRNSIPCSQQKLLCNLSLKDLCKGEMEQSPLMDFMKMLYTNMEWNPSAQEKAHIYKHAPLFFNAMPFLRQNM